MKILVTGGAGFIGSHIADRLLQLGHEVCVLDDLSTGRRENLPEGVAFEQLDVRSEDAARYVTAAGFEALVHQAAQIDVRASVADPRLDADVNVCGLINVVEAARRGGSLRKVLFASSGGAIYGEQERFPATEEHPRQPESPYGVAKLCCEHYLAWFERAYGITHVALRYANVYGPRQDPHGEAGVVAIFSQRLLAGEEVVVYGDGGQTRDFVFVGDVVEANARALARDVRDPINVGTGVETSVNEILHRLARLAGREVAPRNEAARPGEQRRSVIDPARCAELLGFTPATDLDHGLAATLSYIRGAADGG